MPRPYPKEFRDDVVWVARGREPGVTVEQIAKNFGLHPMTLFKWLRQADIDDGAKPSSSRVDSVELREAHKRIRLLEQRRRSCGGPRRICRRQTCREKALPARE